MGKVNALTKVNVQDVETDFDELESQIQQELPHTAEILDTDLEEVAFGLKALLVLISIPDSEGGTEKIESVINTIDPVKSVSIENVDRV